MHGGAAGSGAPKNNQNALKHGLFTKQARDERKQLYELLRTTRGTLKTIK
jgi:glucans biosynthesis protein